MIVDGDLEGSVSLNGEDVTGWNARSSTNGLARISRESNPVETDAVERNVRPAD